MIRALSTITMNRNLHSSSKLTEFARNFEAKPETLLNKVVNRLTSVYAGSSNADVAGSVAIVSENDNNATPQTEDTNQNQSVQVPSTSSVSWNKYPNNWFDSKLVSFPAKSAEIGQLSWHGPTTILDARFQIKRVLRMWSQIFDIQEKTSLSIVWSNILLEMLQSDSSR